MVHKRKGSGGGGLYKKRPGGKRKPGGTVRAGAAVGSVAKRKPKPKPAGSGTRKPAAAASSRKRKLGLFGRVQDKLKYARFPIAGKAMQRMEAKMRARKKQ